MRKLQMIQIITSLQTESAKVITHRSENPGRRHQWINLKKSLHSNEWSGFNLLNHKHHYHETN
jgi:hypothetical protein